MAQPTIPITWKNVTGPSNASANALLSKSGDALGNAISGLGNTVDDYTVDRQKRETDAFVAELNALGSDEERQDLLGRAEQGWLDMGQANTAVTEARAQDFLIADEGRAQAQALRNQAAHEDTLANNLANRDNMVRDDLFADITQADQLASNAQQRKIEKLEADRRKKDYDNNAAFRKLTTKQKERKIQTEERDYANKESLKAMQNTANGMDVGSPERKEYLNASQKTLIKNGMSLGNAVAGFQNFRDEDLAESVGFTEESSAKMNLINFNPAPTNSEGTALPIPSIREFKRYEGKLAKLLKEDPGNKGVSDAAIKAKVAQITNTERYATARLAAIEVQKSIVSQQKVTTLTQTALVENNEKFHIAAELTGSRAVHIEKLLRSEYSSRYPTDAITTDQLTTEIDAVLQKIYDRYNPTSKAQKSAYANAVYKLFARNSAEPSPWGTNWLLGPDVLGNVDTHGKVDDTLSEKSVDLLSDAIAPYLLPADKKTKEEKDELLEKAKKELKGGKKFKSSGNFKNYLYPN